MVKNCGTKPAPQWADERKIQDDEDPVLGCVSGSVNSLTYSCLSRDVFHCPKVNDRRSFKNLAYASC
jgi:hypothetical protein